MSETGDSYQSPEAAEQRSPLQTHYDVISHRMAAIQRERQEIGTPYPPEYFYLSTQERLIMHAELVKRPEPITPRAVNRQLEGTFNELRYVTDKRYPQGVTTLRLAFLAYALPHSRELSEDRMFTDTLSEQINQMQREQIQQTGQPMDTVTLDTAQSQTLTWLFDQVAIPHGSLEEGTHVSLAPLENTLQAAAAANAKKSSNDTSTNDHEARVNVNSLMDQWKKQNNQED